ncbi:MAG: hypothetical protein ACE5E5_12595 [Phycisphaerae bacterium]
MNTTNPQVAISETEEESAASETASIATKEDAAPVLNNATCGDVRPVSSSFRWWLGVVAALIVAAPLSWLLALAANLPFFLGLFFFALFGLMIGAVCFRVAHATQPYARGTVLVGTTLIILATWGGSIWFEAQSFGMDMAREALAVPGLILKGTTANAYRTQIDTDVQSFLSEHYPPGGTIGYIRWVMSSGKIPDGMLASVKQGLRTNQAGWWWIGRVTISIALLAFGVGSQVFPLREPRGMLGRPKG